MPDKALQRRPAVRKQGIVPKSRRKSSLTRKGSQRSLKSKRVEFDVPHDNNAPTTSQEIAISKPPTRALVPARNLQIQQVLSTPPPAELLAAEYRHHARGLSMNNIAHPHPEVKAFLTAPTRCSECGSNMLPRLMPSETVSIPLYAAPEHSQLLFLHILCPSCAACFCRGCLKRARCGTSCTSTPSLGCTIEKCCPAIRLVGLAQLLDGIDQHLLAELERRAELHADASSLLSLNIGFIGECEEAVTKHLSLLSAFLLPHPHDKSRRDPVHLWTASVLAGSCLPMLLDALLRNTSAEEWVRHAGLYHAVVVFVRQLVNTPEVGKLLKRRLHVIAHTCGLGPWLRGLCTVSMDPERRMESLRDRVLALGGVQRALQSKMGSPMCSPEVTDLAIELTYLLKAM